MNEARIADMISKIAHELRSPLTSVKGFSAMLVTRWDRFTDEQRFQFVETIHSDAERMGRIVTEVLDLARMEAGRLELHPVNVSVPALVQKALDRLTELPGAERIETRIPPDLTAWADADRVEGVVANLIENGVKFSDEGPVVIEATSTPEGMVAISVRDEGVGIAPDDIDHVFAGPGGRTSRATPSGSGLGLYLSRGLIEAHGGSITVESKLNKGSVFTVTLPAGVAEVSDEEEGAAGG
ncbi:MAG TPA: HAMP domain-containing sensor histidine kinase [Actinomycetota bacterium]|nr:HAMP domain-containing sensor histidine kinase [Actinomycetota bacterium]